MKENMEYYVQHCSVPLAMLSLFGQFPVDELDSALLELMDKNYVAFCFDHNPDDDIGCVIMHRTRSHEA